MANVFIISGVVFAFLSIALGAFGAHALKNHLNEYSRMVYEKAILYQMFHSIGLILVALIDKSYHLDLFYSGWMFIVGIILFSGSLYILAIYQIKWVGMITPIGGIMFLIGWMLIFVKLIRL